MNGRHDGPGGEGEGGQRQSGAQRKKFAKDKKQRGANKGRRFQKVRDDLELCFKVASGKPCEFGDEYVRSARLQTYSLTSDLAGVALRMISLRILPRSQETSIFPRMKICPTCLPSCGSQMSRWPKTETLRRVLSTRPQLARSSSVRANASMD